MASIIQYAVVEMKHLDKIMPLKRKVMRLKQIVKPENFSKTSYSQCGEDIIVEFILKAIGISRPTYVDIGAHHPININNTYMFYKQGGIGVCVEPDPAKNVVFREKRPRDFFLNVGIGRQEEKASRLFILEPSTLSTFCEEEARRYVEEEGATLKETITVPMLSLQTVFQKYFKDPPDFVSLDVEGLEMEILSSVNFDSYRPLVFCVETLSYSSKRAGEKMTDIIDFLKAKKYMVYGDTFINTIFVDEVKWRDQSQKSLL